MDTILGDLKLSCVLVYLDYINIFSRMFIKHFEHLEQVFRRLAEANIKIKPGKGQFFKEQLEYLGFVVDSKGLSPQLAKVEAIHKMTQPSNKGDIQVLLGMVSYYWRFIPNFSCIRAPLFELLKKNAAFTWMDGCQTSFDVLRSALAREPVLQYPNFEKEFIVKTDASLSAVGALLSQKDDDSVEHPIAYCSCSLTGPEWNYTVTE